MTSVRRRARSDTARSYNPESMGRASGWSPGQEPGIDTSDPAPPYSRGDSVGHDAAHPEKLNQLCEITVVDYSSEDMKMYNLDNDNLEEFLGRPTEDWSMVRWINVNGLSWDVIRLLGNHKGLHRLAIEDLMNTRNRTKADWYSDHTYIVLPLQKLLNLHGRGDCSSDEDSDDEKIGWKKKHDQQKKLKRIERRRKSRGAIWTLLHDMFMPRKVKRPKLPGIQSATTFTDMSSVRPPWAPHPVRTLQRYHSGPNEDRTEFMERHAVLSNKGLGVSIEQVC